MNRFAYIAGRNLRCRASSTTYNRPAHGVNNERLGSYSTKASELINHLPKLWISKMKNAFAWQDIDGDGYVTEKDMEVWEREMTKLFPDMSQERKEALAANKNGIWNHLLGAKGKGPDYKVTEDMYIEKFFHLTTMEGSEDMFKQEWGNIFTVMDINKDGVISKSELQLFFRSWNNPIGAIVAFTAIDENMDGVISREEFTKAGTEYYFNFTDETKPSNYMLGPLKF